MSPTLRTDSCLYLHTLRLAQHHELFFLAQRTSGSLRMRQEPPHGHQGCEGAPTKGKTRTQEYEQTRTSSSQMKIKMWMKIRQENFMWDEQPSNWKKHIRGITVTVPIFLPGEFTVTVSIFLPVGRSQYLFP